MMSSLTTRGGRVALNNNNKNKNNKNNKNASSFQFFGVGDTRSKNNVIRGGAASCSSSRRGSGSFSSDNSNNNNNNNRGFSTTSSSSSSKSNENNSPPQGRKTRFNGDVLQTAKEKKQTKLEGQRLSKALAALGVASRRGSEAIIFDGRVKVNGTKVLEPQFKVNLDVDVIELDDKVVEGGVEYAGEHFYFLVNKPKGYVCSTKTGGGMNNRGEKEESGTGGKKALDLLQAWTEQWKKGNPGKLPPRLFTVGRLDVQTTGMLLVTTDGKWSQRVAHPSSGVVKRYVITAPERVTSAQIAKMRKGTEVDGVHVTPVLVETVTGDGGPKNRVAVEVEDGRNREVRRIAESAGVEVKNLKRTRIGGLKMPSELPAGMFCSLKPHQVSYVLEKSLQQIGGKF
jgi:pseudouridine synthase